MTGGYATQWSRRRSAVPAGSDQIILIRNTNVWQMAEFVVVVQTIADHELIRDFEAVEAVVEVLFLRFEVI